MGAKKPHANSLANLVPGGNTKGTRRKITKSYVQKMTSFLEGDMVNFLAQLESLSTRDQVMVKLKLMDLLLPKKAEVPLGSQVVPLVIQAAPDPTPALYIQEAVVEDVKNEDDV